VRPVSQSVSQSVSQPASQPVSQSVVAQNQSANHMRACTYPPRALHSTPCCCIVSSLPPRPLLYWSCRSLAGSSSHCIMFALRQRIAITRVIPLIRTIRQLVTQRYYCSTIHNNSQHHHHQGPERLHASFYKFVQLHQLPTWRYVEYQQYVITVLY
jgi:hypothetical protein